MQNTFRNVRQAQQVRATHIFNTNVPRRWSGCREAVWKMMLTQAGRRWLAYRRRIDL